jgi:cysteine desulfurase/selenocysteine lyase
MPHTRRSFLASVGAGGLVLPAGIQPDPSPAEFPALAQRIGHHPLAYLDNAATTLRPRRVIEAVSRFYETDNANPSASLHTLARRAAEVLAQARERVARFISAAGADEVIFTRGTTEGVNLVASAWAAEHIRHGDRILVTRAEHASNLFPWQRIAAQNGAELVMADINDDGTLDPAAVERLLTPRTRLVALAHVSNVLGLIYPVREIAVRARRVGAAVFLDAAQSAPHVRLDVQALGCDFVAFSSHKMLGPMGVGVLWVRRARFDEMAPYHVGSNMAHGIDVAGAAFEPGALRFQAGTPNVSGPVGLAAALDVLERTGFEAIVAHDRALVAHGLARLRDIPGLRLLGTAGPDDRVPVFTFTIDRVPVPRIVAAADAAGIAIRGGDMAALPLLARYGVTAAARASAYLYNTTGEIDRLADVLRAETRRA